MERSFKRTPSGKRNKWIISALIVFALFLAGLISGYLASRMGRQSPEEPAPSSQPQAETHIVSISYPVSDGLYTQSLGIKAPASRDALAEAVVREFLKGPGGGEVRAMIPEGAALLGIYLGQDGILYVDLSSDFRANFKGDLLGELMLLKGFYKTINDNVPQLRGIRILIGGKEAESVGGHILLDSLTQQALNGVYNAPL